ncbi:MAG: Dyp-type peroxidase [Sedimenticola sp.]
MQHAQPGILANAPRQARYLTFSIKPGTDPREVLQTLADSADGEKAVVGLGLPLLMTVGKGIDGMRTFPSLAGPGFSIPSTPAALWIWLRGDDRGDLLHSTRYYEQLLDGAFSLEQVIDAFQYRDSRDLTGYEDGTENPEGEEAVNAGIVQDQGPGIDGSSFVAVQQWIHDLDRFQSMPQSEQDDTIGRRISDNTEIEEAPASAHVKRTAQEDFEPEAFILRRSMPWADERQAGLVFVAFGHSFDAFEALLNRMVGKDDGIVDALFRFTHPVSGSYYWCPPVTEGHLNLQALDL